MDETLVRSHLTNAINGKGAHISFDQALAGFPAPRAGERVVGIEHSMWMLVWHMRICLWDIVEFSLRADHVSPTYPEGLWPERSAPQSESAWLREVEAFRTELARMVELVQDNDRDLWTPFPHGTGQTLFREGVLVIDHNSYHIGQMVDLRMVLGEPVRD